MPSTFSTNLGLELPANGEQSGTWGTTVNLNVGTLLEQAISGYVQQAITDGADTTITMPDGATGVARNMMLQLTGTLSAPRNLIVPAKKKFYLIGNATAGGHAVTVKCAGQTGVVVPSNRWIAVHCNGADVYSALSYMYGDISGNAATATTATLAASCSGNAATATLATNATNATTAASVTNGVYTNQFYPDPSWITSLSGSKLSTVPVLNGGTGATTQSAAQANLNVPSRTGASASGTWGISITGSAASVSGVTAIANGGTGSSTGGAFLHYGSGASAVVTYGTGAEPTGADGDIHLIYT